MPPPLQRFGAPINLQQHYQQYQPHSQSHAAGLPPPSLGSNHNPGFMNANSLNNPFAGGSAMNLSGNFGASGLGMAGGTGLASQAAQMSFAGAGQQQGHNGMMDHGLRGGAKGGRIRDVWKENLEEEMDLLRRVVEHYPYIALDTEFPGIVARPIGNFRGKSDYHYQCLRCNVDLLKVIQLGITLFSKTGETLPAAIQLPGKPGLISVPCTWQFNFNFSLEKDMYSETSIETLKQAGVELERMGRDGIDPDAFAALLTSSGLVMDEEVHWISFHGAYDFGYLTKLLSNVALPDDERQFDILMKKFFPSVFDIKFLMKHAIKIHHAQQNMGQVTPQDLVTTEILQKFDAKSGLENLCELFKIKRQGTAHTAGSDALSTGKAFFKMQERIFNDEIPKEAIGKVWGIGYPESTSNPQHSTPQHYHQAHDSQNTPTQNGNNPYANGGPSTPQHTNAGLANTPQHSMSGLGPQTPGGGGQMGGFGAFGNFSMQQGANGK